MIITRRGPLVRGVFLCSTPYLLAALSSVCLAGSLAVAVPNAAAQAAGRDAVPALIPHRPDEVTVVPFFEKPDQTTGEPLQVLIQAAVDGHRGNFLIDLGDPDLDLNRTYLQPTPTAGIDTVTAAHRLPDHTGGDDPAHWDKVQVTLQIGTLRVHPEDPAINTAEHPHRFNATLNHVHGAFGQASEPPFFSPRLGDIGLSVLAQFETIIDFRHRRIILIRLDAAGRRLAAVPAYTPRWSAPLVDVARDAAYYGVQHWWGVAVRTDDTLDTRVPAHNTVVRQISTLPWAYEEGPRAITWNDLGYPFLRQFGVVGFNPRTHRFILYQNSVMPAAGRTPAADVARRIAATTARDADARFLNQVDTSGALMLRRDQPDTVTDTTTALWRRCSMLWEQKQRRLYKRWVTAGDFESFNQHIYPCVRNSPVYVVTAQAVASMFTPLTSLKGSMGSPPAPYRFDARQEYVKGGAMVHGPNSGRYPDRRDTVDSYFIDLCDSPYKGPKEFGELLQAFRAHLPPGRLGGTPMVVLNDAPVSNPQMPIDINHIVDITVLIGTRGTYPAALQRFYHPDGTIVITYWWYP